MKLTISSDLLLQNLNKVHSIIDPSPLLPVLSAYVFRVDKDSLTVLCSDSETFSKITIPINSDVELDDDMDNTFAIPAKLMIDTLKSLPKQPITFDVNLKEYNVNMLAHRTNCRIRGDNPDDFPEFPKLNQDDPNKAINIDFETLSDAFKYTIFATSTDEMRPAMNGIYVALGKETHFTSTDAHRLALYKVHGLDFADKASIIIPNKAVKLIIRVLESTLENRENIVFGFNDSYINFKIDNIEIITRLIDEKFPNYSNIIPKDFENIINVDKNQLRGALKMVSMYADRVSNLTKLTAEGEHLTIFSRDYDYDTEANEVIPCEYEGKKCSIGFNSKYLLEMVKTLPGDMAVLKFNEPSQACILSAESCNELIMLIMPIILPKERTDDDD